ncbi:amino acid/polyamine/organocation transporter, APC superfamily [Chitinophaga jiangningensis]|uniref:Amino acid/polyamine/organocation transporter, APC superfamily n=1 Tax=Chitinophaga jiangningensis TaxID=1419482 RepID=A0A1M7FYC0_9BACT|nr:amino acid permease [Chitinophaga jiangningensis]SHM08970.1 amino acid/polyamine/organocation transporter, APC superfamily [Chitinophaga jiangningensis]
MEINQTKSFKPTLGLLDATMVVAGSMIGSGIFLVTAEIARNVGGAGWITAMWVLAGVVTLIAALSYGELSGMYPKAGGQYVYLREAYNPFIAFLFGWTQFGVIQTGTIAAVAVAFAKFTAYLVPGFSEKNILFESSLVNISAAQIVAIVSIVILTYINTRGVKHGKVIQTVFTLAKLLSLFGLIIFGFLLGAKAEIWNANWENAWNASSLSLTDGNMVTSALSGIGLMGAIAISMKGSLFSSDAWNNVTFIAAEIKNPQKNIGRSLFLGTLIVTIIYVSANLMYLAVLPVKEIAFAANDRVGVAAAEHIFGNTGSMVIAVMIMISTFGCNNGLILSGARIYYTMAQDKLFFKGAGELNANSVPAKGLWIQCFWASFLCLTGRYNDLLALVIFGVLLFYILTILGIFVLRSKRPDIERPYKAFGYPVLPVIYIVVALGLALLLLMFETRYTLPGLGIILMGVPLYYLAMSRQRRNQAS